MIALLPSQMSRYISKCSARFLLGWCPAQTHAGIQSHSQITRTISWAIFFIDESSFTWLSQVGPARWPAKVMGDLVQPGSRSQCPPRLRGQQGWLAVRSFSSWRASESSILVIYPSHLSESSIRVIYPSHLSESAILAEGATARRAAGGTLPTDSKASARARTNFVIFGLIMDYFCKILICLIFD